MQIIFFLQNKKIGIIFSVLFIAFILYIVIINKQGENMFFPFRAKEITFKQKTIDFWERFIKDENQIKQYIDQNDLNGSTETMKKLLNSVLPDVLFQMSKDNDIYQLAFSANGNRTNQILLRYIVSKAPKINNWEFFSSKQPSQLNNIQLSVFDQLINTNDILITYEFNADTKKIDVNLFSPVFKKFTKDQMVEASSILLVEALGENAFDLWIGEIEVSTEKNSNNIPLTEFKQIFDDVLSRHDIDTKMTPDLMWTAYGFTPQEKDSYKPREDIIAGMTTCIDCINAYQEEDLLAKTGAEYVFLMIENFSDIEIMHKTRPQIEERIEKELNKYSSGYIIGGATGIQNTYIDFVIFDGNKSIEIILNEAKKMIHSKVEVRYFAKEKMNIVHQ